MPKDFLSLADWSAEDLLAMLARARELKRLDREGERPPTLRGRVLAMFFEKPSLRTHVTFEAGMTQLGGHAILLRPEQVGIGSRESPADVAAQPLALGRRHRGAHLQPRPGGGARAAGHDPGDQRPDGPPAPLPGDGGPADDRRALRAEGSGARLRRRRQQRRQLAAERGRGAGPRAARRDALDAPAGPARAAQGRADRGAQRRAHRAAARTRWRR